jgi:hypothetical protein
MGFSLITIQYNNIHKLQHTFDIKKGLAKFVKSNSVITNFMGP